MKKILILLLAILAATQLRATDQEFADCMCDKVFAPKITDAIGGVKFGSYTVPKDDPFVKEISNSIIGAQCKTAMKSSLTGTGLTSIGTLCSTLATKTGTTTNKILSVTQPLIDVLKNVPFMPATMLDLPTFIAKLVPEMLTGLCLGEIVKASSTCSASFPASLQAATPVVFGNVAARCTAAKLVTGTNGMSKLIRFGLNAPIFKAYAKAAIAAKGKNTADIPAFITGRVLANEATAESILNYVNAIAPGSGTTQGIALTVFKALYYGTDGVKLKAAVDACMLDTAVSKIAATLGTPPLPIVPSQIPLPAADEEF